MKDTTLTFTVFANSGGCPQNQLDGAHIYAYLTANGYTYSEDLSQADLIILNTCSYRSEKEDQSLAAYHKAKEHAKPGAKVVLTGCVPKIAPDRVRALGDDVIAIPGTQLHQLTNIVPSRETTWEAHAPNAIPRPMLSYVKPFRRYLSNALTMLRGSLPYSAARHVDRLLMYDHSPDTFLIRAAEGCLGRCAYCAIRFSRGALRSKALEAVLQEVERAVCRHEKEILLSGTDLAAWGREAGHDLADLLRAVLDAAPKQYLLLFYANPRWMIDIWDKLEPVFATGRIHFIHLSMNGGSDRLLSAMDRGYTVGEFEQLIRSIKRVSPWTVLQTQIITGFPGETEEDMAETVAFLKRNYFHNVQVHAYDRRPGTPAARMENQVPYEVRQRRRWRLYRLTLRMKFWYDLEYLATGLKIPVEERG